MKWIVLAAALALAGCVGSQWSWVAKADDEQCRQFGAQPGTDAYVQCRTGLEQARATRWSR